MFNKKFLALFLSSFLLISMLGACNTGKSAVPPSGQQQGQQPGQNVQPGQFLRADESGDLTGNSPQPGPDEILGTIPGNQQGQMAPDTQKADNIKKALGKMDGVADADVVVMGNTALVGFKPTATAGDINAAKNNIINRVKATETSITSVTVSENPDVMNRITQLGRDITNHNRSITDISTDFSKIIREVNPMSR